MDVVDVLDDRGPGTGVLVVGDRGAEARLGLDPSARARVPVALVATLDRAERVEGLHNRAPAGPARLEGGQVDPADGDLDERSTERRGDAVDQAARHQRLADAGLRRNAGPVRCEILHCHGQEVVGVQEPARWRHDAVAVGVGVIAERDIEA